MKIVHDLSFKSYHNYLERKIIGNAHLRMFHIYRVCCLLFIQVILELPRLQSNGAQNGNCSKQDTGKKRGILENQVCVQILEHSRIYVILATFFVCAKQIKFTETLINIVLSNEQFGIVCSRSVKV